MTRRDYVAAVIAAMRALPDTRPRTGPADRRIAGELYDRGLPLEVILAAFLIATARRLQKNHREPVRSLAYFLNTIDEIRRRPLDPVYLNYLRTAIARATSTPEDDGTVQIYSIRGDR